MKAKPPFIRSDGIIELYAVTPVGTDISVIIFPSNPENYCSVRFGNSLQD